MLSEHRRRDPSAPISPVERPKTEAKIRSVFLIAGELSGDRYAARLVESLRERIPGLSAEAIGGPHLKAAGVPLFRDSSDWGAIGVAEALKRLPGVWLAHQALKRKLMREPPDLLIPIDFGAFNVPAANYARKRGIPVCYAIPPGSWRPDGGRVSSALASCADVYLTPFSPSERKLREAGLDAHFLGHPLLDFIPDSDERANLRDRLGFASDSVVLGALPGSRGQELRYLTPVFLDAAIRLRNRIERLELAIPLAPSLTLATLDPPLSARGWRLAAESGESSAAHLRRYDGPAPLTLVQGRALEILSAARAAMICSGTATLEAALVGCPMTINYRGGGATVAEYLIRKSIVPDLIGLPNLLLSRRLCPELIQEACSPERLEEEMLPLLTDGLPRDMQLAGFQELRGRMGNPGTMDRWADLIAARFGGMKDRREGA